MGDSTALTSLSGYTPGSAPDPSHGTIKGVYSRPSICTLSLKTTVELPVATCLCATVRALSTAEKTPKKNTSLKADNKSGKSPSNPFTTSDKTKE